MWTINIDTSEGETPLILEACPIDLGLIADSFSKASAESDFILL